MHKKVLIFSLSGVGDSIQFGPALDLLGRSFPQAEFHVLVMSEGAKNFFSRFPCVKHVHCWNFFLATKWQSIRFLARLRRERFDMVVNAYPANRPEYNIVARLLGKKSLGHKYGHYNAFNFYFLNSIVVPEQPLRHPVEENIAIARALGATGPAEEHLLFPLTAREEADAAAWISGHGLEKRLLIGFHPGSSTFKNHVNKRWPGQKFGELGRRLAAETGGCILVFGVPEEQELIGQVKNIIGQHGLVVSNTPLGVTAALIRQCRLFVSNDTGLMHVAAAMQTPCVAIFGPTSTLKGRPFGAPYRIASSFLSCCPCFYYSPRPLACAFHTFECLRDLQVAEVEEHCMEMLKGQKS